MYWKVFSIHLDFVYLIGTWELIYGVNDCCIVWWKIIRFLGFRRVHIVHKQCIKRCWTWLIRSFWCFSGGVIVEIYCRFSRYQREFLFTAMSLFGVFLKKCRIYRFLLRFKLIFFIHQFFYKFYAVFFSFFFYLSF